MSITIDAVMNVVNYSSLLRHQFKSKCNAVISLRKKCASDFYFNMLHYFKISARRSREVKGIIGSVRLSEMIEVDGKLYCKTATGLGDTSRWRVAQFHEIRWKDFACNANKVSSQVGVDRLSKSKVAWKSFEKFLKFDSSSSPDASLSALN